MQHTQDEAQTQVLGTRYSVLDTQTTPRVPKYSVQHNSIGPPLSGLDKGRTQIAERLTALFGWPAKWSPTTTSASTYLAAPPIPTIRPSPLETAAFQKPALPSADHFPQQLLHTCSVPGSSFGPRRSVGNGRRQHT
ncbi:hypothetical protein L209DRAFT_759633 [Thermothelomyces heterothallicus CBS 203.75]